MLLTTGASFGCVGAPAAELPARDANPRWGIGLSALPNLGLEAAYERPLGRRGDVDWASDAHVAYQFIDDETFADDGNPAADGWLQAGVALRGRIRQNEVRDWTFRFGPEWFEARGAPNIVDEPGHYFGVRVGAGFETRIGRCVVGPELSLLAVGGEGEFRMVPQLVWGLRFGL